MAINVGDRIEIKVGDEKGSWGIVDLISYEEFHVSIAGGSDSRIYERSEIRKSRTK